MAECTDGNAEGEKLVLFTPTEKAFQTELIALVTQHFLTNNNPEELAKILLMTSTSVLNLRFQPPEDQMAVVRTLVGQAIAAITRR